MNKNKKGFTIVELVIVIAIIAILAAILIPTFGSVIRTAQTSADVHLVKNLNIALSTAEVLHGRNNTMYDALADAFDAGYDIRKLTPTNADNEILWDQTCDRFVLYVNEEYDVCGRYVDKAVPTGDDTYKLWKIYTDSNITEQAEEGYSIYWNGTAEIAPATVSVGFDAGDVSIAAITYANTDSAKDVVIRTNGGTLTIDAENDTVSHYGFATVVNCNDVKVGTYNENGTVGRLIYSDDSGAIKFMPTAVVYCYMNTSTDSNADANNTTKENGATVYTIVNAGVKDAAYGYVEGDGKTAVTVTDGIVQVNNCLNHNDDYDIIKIGDVTYVVCKCCGGFSKYAKGEDGHLVTTYGDGMSSENSFEVSNDELELDVIEEPDYIIYTSVWNGESWEDIYFTSLEEAFAASKAREDADEGSLELYLLRDIEVNTIFASSDVGQTYACDIYLEEFTLAGNIFLNGTTLTVHNGTLAANVYLNDETKGDVTQNCSLYLGCEDIDYDTWETIYVDPVLVTGRITLNGEESSLYICGESSAENVINNSGNIHVFN